ncbi:hypothetical protein C8F04DRAFT_160199 [Mycena alexandri]|uniref:Uncharacterized protein n=1 Tax=Mycena alexandri TaxID=1745969 RepID=A0AAD6WUW0_9AGAR|nr:hypothetical protein C8F04DRAFT_160199 [Mycena alexandri]
MLRHAIGPNKSSTSTRSFIFPPTCPPPLVAPFSQIHLENASCSYSPLTTFDASSMSYSYDHFHAGPSGAANSNWHSQQNVPYHLPGPYYPYSSGATLGESGTTSQYPDTFSPSYNYADSPEMFSFDDFEAGSPLSPSSASSSSSSCSDAPITPYYPGTSSLPPVALLYTKLDAPAGGEYYDSTSPVGSPYAYEGWEEKDATHKYAAASAAIMHESSAPPYPEYDAAATQWACEEAIAHFHLLDASPTSVCAPDPPTYTTYPPPPDFPAVTSSAASPLQQHTQEYPLCLSPALLSCPPPLKLHQPQPRRSIPVVSLSVLASAQPSDSEEVAPPPSAAHFARTALSPLELQFPASHDARMTSYSLPSADVLPIAAYPSPAHRCPCPECMDAYSIS